MNKIIDDKQCTILWHVDDLKISRVNPTVVTYMITQLQGTFGKEAPLTITCGKVHDYLDIFLDYSALGKVKFSMTDYIKKMLAYLPDAMNAGEAANFLKLMELVPLCLTRNRLTFSITMLPRFCSCANGLVPTYSSVPLLYPSEGNRYR
jgi:hypothetical protein